MQQNSENHRTPVLMRVAFVFLEKAFLGENQVFFNKLRHKQCSRMCRPHFMPFIDRMEVHRDLILPLDEMADLNYLVSSSFSHFFIL